MALLTNQNTWDDFIPAIQFALNNTTHKSIKATPHQVFYGWKSLMPGKHLSNKSAEYMVDYIKDLIIRKRAFELVAEITKQQQGEESSHGKEKAEADSVENLPELKVGSDVWIKLPSKNKLDNKWTSGYKIIKRLGNTCWVNTKSKGRPRRLHITHLKLDNKRKMQ